ncbi:MAG: hypothetical protein QXR12_07190 [Thermofilum sp.]
MERLASREGVRERRTWLRVRAHDPPRSPARRPEGGTRGLSQ